jgi:hypothetical protein
MIRFSRAIALLLLAGGLAACGSDNPTEPTGSPLDGLKVTTKGDTVTTYPTESGPGHFQGTVMGASINHTGDTLMTAPRIVGVVVTIYPRINLSSSTVDIGPAAGSITTGEDGKFTLPTLPSGEYVVTFVPPANSGYNGAWTTSPLRSNSEAFPWWVVLDKK